jgi:hypothetical protein
MDSILLYYRHTALKRYTLPLSPIYVNHSNKTRALLQTTGGKDGPNIVIYAEIVTDIITRNSELKDT